MIGKAYIQDGILLDVNVAPKSIDLNKSTVVYEVFTLQNNSASFLSEHYSRLLESVRSEELKLDKIPSLSELTKHIKDLADNNTFIKNNIRCDFVFVSGKLDFYTIYFIKSTYPSKNQIEKGVKVGLCFGERENPTAKIANSTIRGLANNKIIEDNVFEVLLIDSKNLITEGSRSNVFFIKGNTIYTSKSQIILSGITRQNVIKKALDNNIEIIERDIKLNEISNFDSAFLTSTSMQALPISKIDKFPFNVTNETLLKLIQTQ